MYAALTIHRPQPLLWLAPMSSGRLSVQGVIHVNGSHGRTKGCGEGATRGEGTLRAPTLVSGPYDLQFGRCARGAQLIRSGGHIGAWRLAAARRLETVVACQVLGLSASKADLRMEGRLPTPCGDDQTRYDLRGGSACEHLRPGCRQLGCRRRCCSSTVLHSVRLLHLPGEPIALGLPRITSGTAHTLKRDSGFGGLR